MRRLSLETAFCSTLKLEQLILWLNPTTAILQRKWYVTEFGGGVMILEPKHFGRVFLDAAELVEHESNWEDLEFISRAESN